MSKEQKQPKEKFNRNSELRIRNFDPKLKAELQEIMKLTKKPFESYAVEFLISTYRSDQSLLKQYSQRNSELHSRLNRYVDREAAMINIIRQFLQNTNRYNTLIIAETKKVLKQFSGGTVKPTGGRRPAATRSKSVPRKKGGVK